MPEPNWKLLADLLAARIKERCIIEGCRYTAVPLELAPDQPVADECIWCGEERRETGVLRGYPNLMHEVFGFPIVAAEKCPGCGVKVKPDELHLCSV